MVANKAFTCFVGVKDAMIADVPIRVDDRWKTLDM